MCAVDPVCDAIVIKGFFGCVAVELSLLPLKRTICYVGTCQIGICISSAEQSQERNIKSRISASLVLSSEQPNLVVEWLMHLQSLNVSACRCRHGDRPSRPVFFRGFNFFSRYWISLLKSIMTVAFNILSRTVLLFCNKSKPFS
jgi:hypothetical protein